LVVGPGLNSAYGTGSRAATATSKTNRTLATTIVTDRRDMPRLYVTAGSTPAVRE
jgi:hypothetical protein